MNGISVNTNTGAMQSLEYLSQTNAQLNTVQNAINSGMTVADAQNNGAVFAIAQNMRGDVAGYASVGASLSRATSSVDVALSAGQSISDLLIQMKAQALSASDSSLDTASRQALNENFQALLGQITSVVQNAQFNGVNLIDGSTKQISALASTDGTHRITTAAENMSLSGKIVTIASTGSISTQSKASTMIATVEASLTNVDSALSSLSSGVAKFSIQSTFVSQLATALTTGIGNLVDADMATESAQLNALQVKQQLGVQALSIANSAPQIALHLFG